MKRVAPRWQLAKTPFARFDQARPVVPQRHTLDATLRYIQYRFGVSLQNAIDGYVALMLGSWIETERGLRLNRIEQVYPEAAAEARRAGQQGGEA